MTSPPYIIWLQTILRATGKSQTALAHEMGVTHATLNRWLREKTKPHPQTISRIEALYRRSAFYADLEKSFDVSKWDSRFSALKKENNSALLLRRKDVYDDSLLKLTYHSNRIEGSTLSLRETQGILFDNQVIPKHSLSEHLEVSNHRLAFQEIIGGIQDKTPITVDFVLHLHQILMNGILADAGQFRCHPVRIVGARVVPPNYLKVPEKMADLCAQMEATDDPLGIMIQHAGFEAVHPFADGNGRIGRLLLNYQLLRNGYPLLIVRSERKRIYYDVLEKAQIDRIYEPLIGFMYEELTFS